MNLRFQTPHQYLFIHQNVKHLLILWKKERKRDLYIVHEDKEVLHLLFPGETYVEMVLQEVEPLFFQRLDLEGQTFPVILGATFVYNDLLYAMYYHPENASEQIYFFQISNGTIVEINDDVYEQIILSFKNEFPEYIAD